MNKFIKEDFYSLSDEINGQLLLTPQDAMELANEKLKEILENLKCDKCNKDISNTCNDCIEQLILEAYKKNCGF